MNGRALVLVSSCLLFTSVAFSQDKKTAAAVMDLRAEEGVSQSVSRTLSDYLRTELVSTDKFVLVTRENMEEVLKEQKFQLSGCTDQECAVEAGKLIGVRKMFTGSIGKVGATYIINLKIIDVESGKIDRAETDQCAKCEEDFLIKSIKIIVDKIVAIVPKEIREENVLGRISNKSTAELNADIDTCSKAILLNPKDAEAYNNRGKAYHGLCDYRKAMDNYTKAIELRPEYAEAYSNRGFAYGNLEEYKKSIDDCNKAIKLSPDYAEAYNNRGFAYFNLVQYQNAMDDFNKAIMLSPQYADPYCGRGAVYCSSRDFQKAVDDCSRAITLNPQHALAYFTRGVAYASLKTFAFAACGDVYQAGLLFLKQRDEPRALKCIDIIAKIDPSSPLIKKLQDKSYEGE
jgi:tetratricopeptide (TPR) repeat protein